MLLIFNLLKQELNQEPNTELNNIINDIILRYSITQKELDTSLFKKIGQLSYISLNSDLNQEIINLEQENINLPLTNYINQIILLELNENIVINNNIIDCINIIYNNNFYEINFDIKKYNLNIINKELPFLQNKTITSIDDVINSYKILVNNIQKDNNIIELLYFHLYGNDPSMYKFKGTIEINSLITLIIKSLSKQEIGKIFTSLIKYDHISFINLFKILILEDKYKNILLNILSDYYEEINDNLEEYINVFIIKWLQSIKNNQYDQFRLITKDLIKFYEHNIKDIIKYYISILLVSDKNNNNKLYYTSNKTLINILKNKSYENIVKFNVIINEKFLSKLDFIYTYPYDLYRKNKTNKYNNIILPENYNLNDLITKKDTDKSYIIFYTIKRKEDCLIQSFKYIDDIIQNNTD